MDATNAPNFGRLSTLLHKADSFMGSRVAAAEAPGGGSRGRRHAGWKQRSLRARLLAGAIRSRDEVMKALDGISTYYAKHEPSSPIPLFVARCRSLVMMDFIDIVKELVPDVL